MPKAEKPSRRITDLQIQLGAHLAAQEHVRQFSLRAKILHDSGNLAGARKALEEAERWLAIVRQIERRR